MLNNLNQKKLSIKIYIYLFSKILIKLKSNILMNYSEINVGKSALQKFISRKTS